MLCGIPYEVYHGERKVLAEKYMHVSVQIQPGGLVCVAQHWGQNRIPTLTRLFTSAS